MLLFVLVIFIQCHLMQHFITNDKALATTAGIGTTINPTPVADSVTDVVVAPTIATVSIDSNFEVRVL